MELNIRLIALDLDGTTLLDDHNSISGRMKNAIEDAVSCGISVVPTTGRPFSFLPSSVTSLKGIDYVITSNGSVIYSLKKHKPVYGDYITAESADWLLRNIPKEIFAEIWRCGSIYFSGGWSCFDDFPFTQRHKTVLRKIGVIVSDLTAFVKHAPDAIEKINLPYIPPDVKPEIWRLLSGNPCFSLLDAGEGIEIMNADVTKAYGLRNFCRYLQKKSIPVGFENILAVGDSENDVEMLQSCGIGVAMGNSAAVTKQAADYITLRNTEDGAALAIEKYALVSGI